MRIVLVSACAALLVWFAACGSDDSSGGARSTDASVGDAVSEGSPVTSTDGGDPRCLLEPTLVATHPHASTETTETARDLIDVRGFHGRLYFAYGDLDKNTGPVVISSLDPTTKTWQDHLTFATERVERFHVINDALWAPAADPASAPPDPEYAIGSAEHVWKQVDIGASLHVTDAIERVPGEVLLTGSAWINDAHTLVGGTVWRSSDAGPFERIFPIYDDAGATTLADNIFVPFSGAALGGTAYMTGLGPAWIYDGGTWSYGAPLSDFLRPVAFRDRLVYASGGELWSSDGTTRKRLDFLLLETPQTFQFTFEPLPIFQATEGRIIAVDRTGTVRMTTDLATWTCLGRAPADVRSIGSLGAVVYLGGSGGRVFAFERPSW